MKGCLFQRVKRSSGVVELVTLVESHCLYVEGNVNELGHAHQNFEGQNGRKG